MRFLGSVLAISYLAAAGAVAQEQPGVFVAYSMDMKGSVVKGSMMIAKLADGKVVPQSYTLKRVVDFITEDCASGKVGRIKVGKKRVKRGRGYIKQDFKTTCLGGPHPRIGATRVAQVTIERQGDGRDLAEYFYSKNGDMVTMERYR